MTDIDRRFRIPSDMAANFNNIPFHAHNGSRDSPRDAHDPGLVPEAINALPTQIFLRLWANPCARNDRRSPLQPSNTEQKRSSLSRLDVARSSPCCQLVDSIAIALLSAFRILLPKTVSGRQATLHHDWSRPVGFRTTVCLRELCRVLDNLHRRLTIRSGCSSCVDSVELLDDPTNEKPSSSLHTHPHAALPLIPPPIGWRWSL